MKLHSAQPAEARAPQSAGDRLLAIKGLRVGFPSGEGEIPAVRGVDLSIGRGEIVALVGESGSGKSTIGNALMRLFHEDSSVRLSGEALFLDRKGRRRDLLHLSDREMRNIRGNEIAMIFQEPLSSLNPIFSVGKQITEAIRTHQKMPRNAALKEAQRLLELLGLPNPRECLANYPHQISGGMRQRVMIAMALACNPSLLIADEPTTALDVTIQAQIIDLLQKLQQQTGMAILFITHDLGLVAEIADRVLVMYAGQIVEAAPAERIFEQPLMPYTQALLDAIPDIGCSAIPDYELRPIPGNAPNPLALPEGCAFHPRCPHSEAPVCTSRPPEIEEVSSGRSVRCFRWRDLTEGGAE